MKGDSDFYDHPYICLNYKSGRCDFCRQHDERKLSRLSIIFWLIFGLPETVGFIDKGYEDKHSIKISVLVILSFSLILGVQMWFLTDSIVKQALNYHLLSKWDVFYLQASNAAGTAFMFFALGFIGLWVQHQFHRISQYSKKKYGIDYYGESVEDS